MNSYIILAAFWVVFYFLHSFMITMSTKKFLQKYMKSKFKYYRLIYNIFSTIAFLLILWYAATLPVDYVYIKNPVTNYLGLFLAVLGVIVGKRGFKPYDTGEFLGFRQIKKDDIRINDGGDLKTEGILGKIRHPLYSATILLVVGFWLFSPTIANSITVGAALVYLIVGIQLEEKKLIRQFGQAYINYKKQVPSLVPKFW